MLQLFKNALFGRWLLVGFFVICFATGCLHTITGARTKKEVQVAAWLTTPDKKQLFAKETPDPVFSHTAVNLPTIEIDTQQKYQVMDGFGYTLTGGSAKHMYNMNDGARKALLTELFDTVHSAIGVSYLRVSIGASDLSERVFSYNDLPAGEKDMALKYFDLSDDKKALIPLLKEILSINPHLKIMGSPWSAPVWMKTVNDTRGGSLKPEYYSVYAQYLVKYVQAMKNEGIAIDAITVQNEPLHPGNNPSMYMTAEEQALFIKNNLGPAFKQAGLQTKIIIYDHNADKPEYPLTILNDPEAKKYVDGSAFHLYGGSIDALSKVHDAHPDKHIYFTEQWIGAPGNFAADVKWHVRHLIIGAPRNWARTVLEWNLANGPDNKPHTDRGGCDRCLGAITVDGNAVTRNPAYYIIAHASKFVRPGSVRVGSNMVDGLPNVAFVAPSGNVVLIVLNESAEDKTFAIKIHGKVVSTTLTAGSVGTYVW